MSLSSDLSGWGDSLKDATAPSPAPARAAAPVVAAPAPAAAPAVVEWVEGKIEESAPDADGVITVTEYTTDKDSGKRQKVTRKVKRHTRMARVPVGVRERAEWAPFGKALEGNVGTTMRSYDDLHFEVPGERVKSDLDKFIENNTSTSIFKCTICGGGHSTLKCPYRDVMPAGGAMGGAGAGAGAGAAAAGAGGPGAGAGTGAYVPPHLKEGFRGGGAGGEGDIPEYELRRIRIGNLHEDADEDEVRALVDTPLGRVEKVTLARHKESGKVTAAYVQFSSHEAADAIRRNLDGFGYEHLVLKVEWARPNPNKDFTGSAGLSGGFVSGYGKALPQNMRK